jgi:glycerophosphoryl diester phosphodiesterase
VLGQIRDRGVRARYVFLVDVEGAPADQVARHGAEALPYSSYLTVDGMAALAAGADGISFDKHLLQHTDASGAPVGAELVARAHAAGLTVFCWTLRAENRFLAETLRNGPSASRFGDWKTEFLELMGMGVDGVFTDQPDLAIAARSALRVE